MSTLVFTLVLAAACMHAGWNAIVKVVDDRLVSLTLINLVHSGMALLALPFVAFPAAAAWPFLIASVVIHFGYYVGLIMQYRFGDLSHVYPLARGTAPLLVAAVAWLWAGEVLDPLSVLAVLLVTGGILSLALSGRAHAGSRHAVAWALFTAMMIAGYSLADGFGGRASGDVLGYIAWLFLLDGLTLLPLLPFLRPPAKLIPALARHWRGGLAGGVLSTVAYGLVIWAMSQTPLALVTSLRETSVIIAAGIGTLVLGEPFGRRRILAACLVVLGIALLEVANGIG
ncbi:MAG: EamA family transporter [Alphaproteobacteria bacterium]|nr:EamA family transporter [Alphaproteobacteria bacterium]MDP6816050.1 EamA family transporter [Alphaproteobacteria bacterium]